MQHSNKPIRTLKLRYLLKCLPFFGIAVLMCHSVYAASQGKSGSQSTATVEISVTVHQSLSAISPNEITLNRTNEANLTASKPFCIANNGYEKNANVPYELIVDRLESTNSDADTLPFNVFLEDKNNKQLLTNGATVVRKSNLKSNENLFSECKNAGTTLSIKNNNSKNIQQSESAGLLLLLVSPY